MIQTTSPSYILMSSLDIAREILATDGERLLGELLDNIRLFKLKMQVLDRLSIVDKRTNVFDFDQTRLVIHCRRLGISGFDLDKELRNKFNVQPELCDLYNVVFITTMDNVKEDFDALFNALVVIHEENKYREELSLKNMRLDVIPNRKYAPSEAFSMTSVRVPLSESESRISTASVVPYPPGIPVLCPGEEITKASIEYIEMILDLGGSVNNIDSERTIEVVAKADIEQYEEENA
jgi:arginine/lysine/ornithine decarboxylase